MTDRVIDLMTADSETGKVGPMSVAEAREALRGALAVWNVLMVLSLGRNERKPT